VRINGLSYQVRISGNGERALLLLHGFTGHSRNWDGLVAGLAPAFRLIRVDLPGHGRSAAPTDPDRYAMAAVAADLEIILAQAAAVPADVLGYSMGGRLALYLALTRPHLARSLILESASPGLRSATERQTRRQQDEALARRIEQEGVAAFVRMWEELPIFGGLNRLPASGRDALRRQRLDNRPAGLANSLRGMGAGSQPSLWERLPELSIPVLLLAGELDEKFVAINQEMAAVIPQASLVILPGAGHIVHLEQPQPYREAVARFLL
jgi:2-succinyl-6-hydroxy-2,4-cyclohexadiene-1-carboxylate synthase